MRARVVDVTLVSAAAAIATVVMAAFVLSSPANRVFGVELVGRHHDPFTVMEQMARPMRFGLYSQPVTDVPGALLARLWGPVAAYNFLVLLTFPLSAASAWLLARHLRLSRTAASVAAMAYAFSPFHLAQAAYHPHIAQAQWLPLYLLALWRCLDHPSGGAVLFLSAAAVGVTLSNLYAGLIAGVISPICMLAYWTATSRTGHSPYRRLAITSGVLLLLALAGVAYASHAFADGRMDAAFPRADLFRYSAKWWSYLIPPAAHPLIGTRIRRFWTDAGVGDGLLEQQLSLGWGIIALASIAIAAWLTTRRGDTRLRTVPSLAAIASVALVCSLSPERTIGTFTFIRPSALLYQVAPMFRAYARFGAVVQLMSALLAGIGIDWLRRVRWTAAPRVSIALVGLAAAEYFVLPSAMWRDVLPTAAHRWVMQQHAPARVLDCAPLDQQAGSIQWLTNYRITLAGGTIDDCTERNLPQTLAAIGYTHLLVRRRSPDGQWFARHATPDGLVTVVRFPDSEIFAVSAQAPAVYTAAVRGFSKRERDADWSWRWIGGDAAVTIVNTTVRKATATLSMDMAAFDHPRHMEVLLDGSRVQTLVVFPGRRQYELDPLTLAGGSHELAFHAVEPATIAATVAPGGDGRPLSFALGEWTWTTRE